MHSSPILRHGNTLVVFDGPPRLLWSAADPGHYVPSGLWPSPAEAASVLDHLADGGNVLVMLGEEDTTIPMYVEEAASIPAELADRIKVTTDGALAYLHLTALDWLPDDLRRRGLRFLRDTDRMLASLPDALLPPLLLEEPDSEASNLRFGRLRTVRTLTEDRILPLSNHFFAPAASASPSEWETSS
ncbi:hypothetical protein AQJ23_03785 [Streptomyces antibioticus]|nr:hypothetical protein [Streptomyces antibioticus]KUN29868.1 hypothetical protein AQJ23_03785 [Streptomyces antibioticus]